MYWKGFTTRGALWSIYGGLVASVGLVLLSPALSGGPTALLPGADFAFFPLGNPAVVSIPLGFLLGWLGSLLDPSEADGAEFTESEVRILAGAGSVPENEPAAGAPPDRSKRARRWGSR
ncbi:hypothetical protein ACFO9E_33200 [Streptomyces maoxianensis]|uniref:Cation acetate symporter n=1 Tax=Streptomyces maoxianensis TaxID=1459942 RepID=A0ABV9GGB3_9ACTN